MAPSPQQAKISFLVTINNKGVQNICFFLQGLHNTQITKL